MVVEGGETISFRGEGVLEERGRELWGSKGSVPQAGPSTL